MVINTRVNLKMEKGMEKEYFVMQMETNMKADIKTGKGMEKVSITVLKVTYI
jgi:hypothetical protein